VDADERHQVERRHVHGKAAFARRGRANPVPRDRYGGAVTDLRLAAEERPDLGKTFEQMMPDYVAERASRFCGRSAVCWPERITAPVLIAQGGADQAVSVEHAIRLARALEQAKKPYRLLVIGGANHPIEGSRQLLFDEAERLFRGVVPGG
jgi:pimeloyl-ACP methyl ester carboxylesterase